MSAVKQRQPPLARIGLMMALTASPIGCAPARTPAELEAIALIERLGGTIKTDAAAPRQPVVAVALGGTQVADADLTRLTAFADLRTLSLFDTLVGDEGIEQLAALDHLQTLYLGRTRVTDAGLQRLAAAASGGEPAGLGLRELQTIGLSDTSVTDASLDFFVSLARLKSVNLRHTRVTARGAARLKRSRPGLVVHW
jgi:hypothetical protein